jgi:hypothetical protein
LFSLKVSNGVIISIRRHQFKNGQAGYHLKRKTGAFDFDRSSGLGSFRRNLAFQFLVASQSETKTAD